MFHVKSRIFNSSCSKMAYRNRFPPQKNGFCLIIFIDNIAHFNFCAPFKPPNLKTYLVQKCIVALHFVFAHSHL